MRVPRLALTFLALAAVAVFAGCNGGGTSTPTYNSSATPVPIPSGSAFSQTVTNQAAVVSGASAAVPVPSNLPFATSVTLPNASLASGTTFSTTVTSSTPTGLPTLSVGRRAQGVPSSTFIEHIQVTPSQDVAFDGDLAVNVQIPNSYIVPGAHFWGALCYVPSETTACPSWDYGFPATVTTSASTSSLAIAVPLAALPGGVPHTISIYTVSDAVPVPTSTPSTTSFTVSGNKIMLSVNSGTATSFVARGVAYAPTQIGQCCIQDPLGNENSTIWQADLPTIKALGANAVRVYNVSPTSSDISQFLTTAYSSGIYTMLTYFMTVPSNSQSYSTATINSYVAKYQSLAKKWGGYPGFLGLSIGTEINCGSCITTQLFWQQLNMINKAIKKGYKFNNSNKLTFTAMVDDNLVTMSQGKANQFAVDVWGFDIYRGADLGCPSPYTPGPANCIWTQVPAIDGRPFMATEWGAPRSYHPNPSSVTQPTASELPPYPVTSVSGSPSLTTVVNFMVGIAKDLNANATSTSGVSSGGFIFEYNDEWWNGGPGTNCNVLPNPVQCGGLPGNASGLPTNPNFPGQSTDLNWFGLVAITTGTPNGRTIRPTYTGVQGCWVSGNCGQLPNPTPTPAATPTPSS